MIQLAVNNGTEVANFPTKLKEITGEYLERLTKHVNIPANKVIICMCKSCNISEISLALKTNRKINVGVACLIAKVSEDATKTLGYKIGDIANIAASDLERSIHLHVKTVASYDSFVEAIKEANGNKIQDFHDTEGNICKAAYAIEFKIVNLYDVVASIPFDAKVDDPFKVN